jgi:lipopolysaccharide transport system ATP-binding protein
MDQPRARNGYLGLNEMSDVAITVENLSKIYTLRGPRQRYRTMRDSIMETLGSPFRSSDSAQAETRRRKGKKNFLALDDVSFTIPRGEAVGVIGHNGAGKSTLLKILSRITEPTKGSATLFGRVGSLLEVGTGFHLELSGRENIYLSGAIIGMKKTEIDASFDEMVAFAEVEEFIDTPVKHYSSGMHLRLAFAVAAHLQPEILLIDEVLAVGDARFQKKCLGKMDDVAASGRTVLFVSHNLSAMKELCRSALVLSHGRLLLQAPIVEAISKYTESVQDPTALSSGAGWQKLRLLNARTEDEWVIQVGDAMTYEATLIFPEDLLRGAVMLLIADSAGTLIVHQRTDIEPKSIVANGYRRHVSISAGVPALWLAPGLYTVCFKFVGRSTLGGEFKYLSERRILDVKGWSRDGGNAFLAPPCEWSVQRVEDDVLSTAAANS